MLLKSRRSLILMKAEVNSGKSHGAPTYYLGPFSRKLHGNEKKNGPRGGCAGANGG